MYKTIVEAVLDHASKQPEKTAIAWNDTVITYEELAGQMRVLSDILADHYKVKSRDKIMISGVSRPEYVVTLLAVQYLGAITIPVDKTALSENISDVYHFNEADMIFTDTRITDDKVVRYSLKEVYQAALKARQEKIPVRAEYTLPDPELVAEMLFTTGTTGRPKGVMLSYGNLLASTHNNRDGVGILPEDILLCPMPMNHSVGMRNLRTILYLGATMVLENGFTFPKKLKTSMERYHCTGFVCVPAVLERLYRQMGENFLPVFGSLRYMEIGSGSLSYDMKKRLIESMPDTDVVNTWGSTETGGTIFLHVCKHPDKLTSLGKAVEGVEVKVTEPEGEQIQNPNLQHPGRMALRGAMQMKGYYGLEEASADALREGWLYTNDLVYTDSDGYIYMLGRIDDIINVGGEKVSPIEVENLASEHPKLYECACIGVDDPEGIFGQVPVLIYVAEEGENPQEMEILRFLSGRMENYKLPKYLLQVEELPRNRLKKLDRKKIRALWEESL